MVINKLSSFIEIAKKRPNYLILMTIYNDIFVSNFTGPTLRL